MDTSRIIMRKEANGKILVRVTENIDGEYRCNDRNYEIISTTGAITAANQSELDRWFEVDTIDLTTPDGIETIINSIPEIWLYPTRPIKMMISSEVIDKLVSDPQTSQMIILLHSRQIPFVKTSDGFDVYFEEIEENDRMILEYLGATFKNK